jgi:hypothetical protein
MNRNLVVFTGLVIGQLAVGYVLKMTPELVNWSWQVRLAVTAGIFLGLGAITSVLFRGSFGGRIAWVAGATALPSVIAEAVSWSDPAYPKLGYLVAIVVAVVASLGALITLMAQRRSSPE